MKFPKSIALLLIVGLILSSCSFGESYPISESPSQNPVTRDQPSSRNDLTGLSGGEQNIDPFTVNPINRWDSSSTGPLTTGISNGELSLETYLNDSSEAYYFRESSTADDTISVRWRLNQTADGEFANLDYAGYGSMMGRSVPGIDWGTDGWGWEEEANESSHQNIDADAHNYIVENLMIYEDGDRIWEGSFVYAQFNFTGLPIDADKYDTVEIKCKAYSSELGNLTIDEYTYLEWWDDSGLVHNFGRMEGNNSWMTLSYTETGSQWTGTESTIAFWLKTAAGNTNDWETDPTYTIIFRIDYVRLTPSVGAEIQGDFAIPLCGLNATTSEGSGNTTLTAYQHNGTHYTIRPSFTTEDGTNSRSWNMDSEYQDFYQMKGLWGSDGLDYLEGIDGTEGAASSSSELGYCLNLMAAAGADYIKIAYSATAIIDTELFSYFTIKWKGNDSTAYFQINGEDSDGVTKYLNETKNYLTTDWQIETFNLSADTDWTGFFKFLFFRVDEDDGTLEGDEAFWIDWCLLTSIPYTDDDREFFEFNEYYRAELDYDLRSSELEFELQDDLGDDIVKEEIGDLTIADYFDAQDLIPDIFQGQVGQIDYLLGLRTAGSNGTCWWDYYQAEFQEHSWEQYAISESGDDFEGKGPYGCHNIADGGTSPISVRYKLVVPEFDAASGKLIIDELNGSGLIKGSIALEIYTVSPDTGATHFEADIYLVEGPENKYAHGSVYPGNVFEGFNTNNGRTGFGEIAFSFFLDKTARQLNLQFEAKDDASHKRRASATWDMTAGTCNEIVFKIVYSTTTNAGGSGSEIVLSLDDWAFTSRDIWADIFGGLPGIDDLLGGLAAILGHIFRALLIPVALGLETIAKGLEPLENILSELQAIAEDVTNLSNILTAVRNIPTMVADVGSILDDWTDITTWLGLLDDMWDIVETIVADIIQEFITFAGDLTSAFVDEALLIIQTITDGVMTFIRGIGVGGTTIGDALDVVGEILDLFIATVGDTIQFILMILTEWALILMVLIFVGILFIAVASSEQPGQVIGNIWKPLSTNIMPFSILGFRMHVPLVVLLIPFLFIVILGIV